MLTVGAPEDRALHPARLLGTDVLAPRSVVRIDPVTRELVLEGGESLPARTVVFATGVTWRRLEIGGKEPGSLSPFGPNVSRSPRS